MFQKLVNRNEDLRRLVDKGYAVAFDSNHLVVRDIPYLDEAGNLQNGAFVAKLEFVDQEKVVQADHQVLFAGGVPHGLNGAPIPNLGGGGVSIVLSDRSKDVVVQRSFSNKPKPGDAFPDFFAKIESYAAIVSGPAMEKHPEARLLTFRAVTEVAGFESMFKYRDTLTSLAGISDLAAKFKDDVVAVIGLGGTGAYVLDFLVKTPVREIRAFDYDQFHIHNAYRSPGRQHENEFGLSKRDVYSSRYGSFRNGLSIVNAVVDASSAAYFEGVTFAFVCVDKGSSRAGIFDLLLGLKIPFIDVGMGLHRKEGALDGMARMTYYSAERGAEVRSMRLAELVDAPADEYRNNIQIAELNALNACLAVLRFKQLRRFYYEEIPYYHLLFGFGDQKTAGET